MSESNSNGIAIIGVAGRFPGAASVDEFWRNLVAGKESISIFSDEELAASGLDVAALRKDPNYVAARGTLSDVEYFDAAFFDINAKQAEIIDPQQRLFLEASWSALEQAGYNPDSFQGAIGVYAGMANETYFINNLHSRRDLVDLLGERIINLGNAKDFLALRVAYKLNLRGPALSINTACSTGLVVICQACQSLLSYQCDLALAGGVAASFPQHRGVRYQENGIFSPDGCCRAFDIQAQGTVSSEGLGVVVLKRLAEALEDGDHIYAVIKGFGLNNDGSNKVGFTAPSVEGQAEAIAIAQADAGFDPASISYIECHGTATPIGDPIEIAALTQAFRLHTNEKNFCAIGSVKGNIGHTDTAAGVAGLIKTALALKHKTLPASLHFEKPNPKIDFANSPFFVNSRLTEWKAGPTPRRAGVSSFGVGGTNAHVVLEEAPDQRPSSSSRPWQLLVLSAKTAPALEAASANLLAHLKAHADLNLADAAFTLQAGRAGFQHRRMLVCRDLPDAIKTLESPDPKRIVTQQVAAKSRPIIFMFSGQGAQYVNMGVELYHAEPVFKEEIDRCAKILMPHLGLDLRQVLFPAAGQEPAAEELLLQTRITQPALFVFEYALAQLWQSWGIVPGGVMGHSVGGIVAACVAGVFTLEDALAFVARRAQLVQNQPKGAMLAVRLPEEEIQPLLTSELSIAAINAPSLCVVSGPFGAIEGLEIRLKEQGVAARRLHTSHAFHSAMMDPVLEPLAEFLAKIKFHRPTIPFISDVTGRRITEQEATDPQYWVRHVRQAVRFADGVGELFKNPESILLEVGPGQTLSPLANQHPGKEAGHIVLSSLSASKEQEVAALLNALGRLWLAGEPVDWTSFYRNEKRRRITLPTYPFERKRFWVEPIRATGRTDEAEHDQSVVKDISTFESPKNGEGTHSPAIPAESKTGTIRKDSARANTIASRQQQILAILKAQFEQLSGTNLNGSDSSVSFVEMGFDSLLIVQASHLIAKRFGIMIAFRQLQEEITTLNQLAGFLDQKLPADALPVIAPPSPEHQSKVLNTPPASTDFDGIQARIQDLTRQLELLHQARSAQLANDLPTSSEDHGSIPISIKVNGSQSGHASPPKGAKPPATNGEGTEYVTFSLSGNGSEPPLFHVPGVAGVEPFPMEIAQRIGQSFRFYDSFLYQGLDGSKPPLSRIEDIASYFVPQIQRIWPQGPYWLSGYSFGGLVALEIARQLQAQGSQVDLLMLMDTVPPFGDHRRRSLIEIIKAINQRTSASNGGSRFAFLTQLTTNKLRRLFYNKKGQNQLSHRSSVGNPLPTSSMEAARKRLTDACNQAVLQYKCQPYEGKVILFQAEFRNSDRGIFYKCDDLYGWRSLVSEVKTIPIDGEHGAFFQPPAVSILAEKLLSVLNEHKTLSNTPK